MLAPRVDMRNRYGAAPRVQERSGARARRRPAVPWRRARDAATKVIGSSVSMPNNRPLSQKRVPGSFLWRVMLAAG